MAHLIKVAGASFKVWFDLSDAAERAPICALKTTPANAHVRRIDHRGIANAALVWLDGGVEWHHMVWVYHGNPLGIKADAKGIQQA